MAPSARRIALAVVLGIGLLGHSSGAQVCPGDVDGNGAVSVDEVIAAVNSALYGCADPTPTPSPRPSQRFVNNGDGTITDTATRLMWEAKDSAGGIHDVLHTYPWSGLCADSGDRCQPFAVDGCPIGAIGCGTCADCVVSDGQGTATTAFGWVSQLNAEQFAGHVDWRLPSYGELRTLLAEPFPCDIAVPCIDPPFRTDGSLTAADAYWSTSTQSETPNAAWYIRFSDGFEAWTGKTDAHHVRAVRTAP